MEYQEVTSKKTGKQLVFCNFKELLKEAYGVKTMDEVETHLKGDEYIIHCPFCKAAGHTKHKLYIKSDLTVGNCFVCTRGYVNVDDEIRITYNPPQFKLPREPWKVVPLEDPVWSLDRFQYEFEDYSESGIQYLTSRNPFLRDLWQPLGFKFWEGNIVMPFWWNSEVIYYQIRFTKPSKIRYFFPRTNKKPPYYIPNGDHRKLIIVEGVYDAIACLVQAPGYSPFAVLGSSISEYQLDFLRSFVPNEVLVYMDDTEKSRGIARTIRKVIDYCPIRVIPSDGTDPEENMMARLRMGKQLNWIK